MTLLCRFRLANRRVAVVTPDLLFFFPAYLAPGDSFWMLLETFILGMTLPLAVAAFRAVAVVMMYPL